MRRRASFLVLSAADFSTFPSLASPRNYRSKGVYIYITMYTRTVSEKSFASERLHWIRCKEEVCCHGI